MSSNRPFHPTDNNHQNNDFQNNENFNTCHTQNSNEIHNSLDQETCDTPRVPNNQQAVEVEYYHGDNSVTTQSASSTHVTTPAVVATEARSNSNSAERDAETSAETNPTIANATSNTTSTSEDEKAQIRSQRKRHREKQRRSDINSQFASLMSLLKKVEADDLDSDISDDEEDDMTNDPRNGVNSFGPPKKKKKKIHIPAGSISNRIDLIARTIAIMERLHQVNSSLRTKAKAIKKSLNKLRNDYNIQKSSICDVSKSVDNSMDKSNHMMSTMMGGMGMPTMAMPGVGTPGGMMMMVPGGTMNMGNGQTGGREGPNQQVGLSPCKTS